MKRTLAGIAMVALAVAVSAAPAGAQVDTAGLVAWYPFSGNAGDSSGHGNHGTVYGAALCPDRFGDPASAYAFDGVDDYILVPDAADLEFTTALTVSAWIRPGECPVTDQGCPVLAKGTGSGGETYCFDISDDGTTLRFLCWSGGFPSMVKAYDWLTTGKVGQWIHVAVVYNGSGNTAEIYENGNLIASRTDLPATLATNPHALSIGSRQSGSSQYDLNFNGALDDIRLFSRALSQAEIDTLAGNTSGLVAPVLISPEDSAVVSTPHFPVFTWHRVDSAEYYRYQISSSSSFSYFLEDFTLVDTSYTLVTSPVVAEYYYWRVIACKGIYNRVSPTRMFQFGVPTLVAPPMDSIFADSNTPTFVWNQVDSASYYDLRVSTDRTMSSNFVIIHSLADTAYTTFSPLGDGHYYWQVKARGNPTLELLSSVINHFGVNVYGGVAGRPVGPVPPGFKLGAPYPNPARSNAVLHWDLPEPGGVRLEAFNVAGQRIATLADGQYDAGRHTASWDLRDHAGYRVANGVYIFRLTAGGRHTVGKLTVIR